jgi:hypothetical protein
MDLLIVDPGPVGSTGEWTASGRRVVQPGEAAMDASRRCKGSRGLVAVGVASLAWMACVGVPSVPDLAAATSGLGPYRPERRLAVYGAVDDAVKRLYGSIGGARREVVKTVDLPDGAGRLELARFRGEGPPVQFALGGDTQDFGFLLDLDGDGKVDYLVFNGGPLFDKTLTKMHWMNYHWIETDRDGRVDVLVFNAVDLDGDHFYDEGVTAWLYDRNHDGLVDDAEYLGPFGSRPVERQGDDFVLRLALGENRVSTMDAGVLGGPTRVLQRVQGAMP